LTVTGFSQQTIA